MLYVCMYLLLKSLKQNYYFLNDIQPPNFELYKSDEYVQM